MANPTFKSSIGDKSGRNDVLYLNGEPYTFELFFVNDSGVRRIDLNAFVRLEIGENFNSPFYFAKLILNNTNNQIESFGVPKEFETIKDYWFNFNGQGTDCILFKISTSFLADNYSRQYLFAIEDEFNVSVNGGQHKEYQLIDINAANLEAHKKGWSTMELLPNSNQIAHLPDEQLEVYTGAAVQGLLTSVLGSDVINADQWDRGNTKTTLSLPYNHTAMYGIMELLDRHISHNDDLSLLRYEGGKFNLSSFKDIVRAAFSEARIGINDEVVGNFELVTPASQTGGFRYHPFYKIFSQAVSNYKFLNPTGKDGQHNMVNHKVVKYDFDERSIHLNSETGSIENLQSYVRDCFPSNRQIEPNFDGSANVKDSKSFKNLYTTSNTKVAKFLGRNELLKRILSLSLTLDMTSRGFLPLHTGKFVHVVRNMDLVSEFEKNINGLWFVVEYTHIFTPREFATNAIATKFYREQS